MSRSTKITLATVAVLGAILALAGLNLRPNATFYYTVDEYLAKKADLADKYVQVKGYVVPGSLRYDPMALDVRFTLEDGGKTLQVFHHGAKPDTLTDEVQPATGRGIEVVAGGRVDENGVFQARQLLVKCPSRYIETQKGSGSEGKRS